MEERLSTALVILCIHHDGKKRLGATAFDIASKELLVLENDVIDPIIPLTIPSNQQTDEGHFVLHKLFRQINPIVIVTSVEAPQCVLKAIEKWINESHQAAPNEINSKETEKSPVIVPGNDGVTLENTVESDDASFPKLGAPEREVEFPTHDMASLEIRPAADFELRPARLRLVHRFLEMVKDPINSSNSYSNLSLTDEHEQVVSQIGSMVDWDGALYSLAAAGALIEYLETLNSFSDWYLQKNLEMEKVKANLTSMQQMEQLDLDIFSHLDYSKLGTPGISSESNTLQQGSRLATFDLRIGKITSFRMNSYLSIDHDTLYALQIFPESSISTNSTIPTSIFDLLNYTRSAGGKWALRQYMMSPLSDYYELQRRLNTIKFWIDPKNDNARRTIHACLTNVRSLGGLFSRCFWSLQDWISVVNFAEAAANVLCCLRDVMQREGVSCGLSDRNLTSPVTSLFEMASHCENIHTQRLSNIAQGVLGIVDFEASKKEKRVVPRMGVDPLLDDLRCQYHALPALLTTIADQMKDSMDSSLASMISLVYFPQIGFLVAFPRSSIGRADVDLNQKTVHGAHHDFMLQDGKNFNEGQMRMGTSQVERDFGTQFGLEFQFVTPVTAYYKSKVARDLDYQVGDLHGMLIDREIDVLFEFLGRFQEMEQSFLMQLHAFFIDFDVQLALAEGALLLNLSYPTIIPSDTEHNVIAKKARHPLIEITGPSSCVPNDIELGHGVSVLTGANASGKSVYLKAIALIVYLAHIGSFVPADNGTQVGLTDQILSRVSIRESISKVW
jgi:hypothetical protein